MQPLVTRREKLTALMETCRGDAKHLFLSPLYAHGKDLFQTVKAEGLEGIVAKRKDSPYLPGKRTLLWQKIKNFQIELHVWFSRWQIAERPDFAVFDLDPAGDSGFAGAREVALLIKRILDELKLKAYPKTSGKRGIHLYIPVKQVYTYRQVRKFLEHIGRVIVDAAPSLATLEWDKEKRESRVYIDFRQNARGKTLAAPYSLRPVEGAPVSTPITWQELEAGLSPADFNINTIKTRLEERGDLFSPVLTLEQLLSRELLQKENN